MRFIQWLNEDNSDLQQLVNHLLEKYPEIEVLHAWENDYKVQLGEITIGPNFRNQGIGSMVVQELKQFAASVNKPLVLTPQADKGKKSALDRFYRKQGMVHNKGKNTDHRLSGRNPTMYWKPNENDD